MAGTPLFRKLGVAPGMRVALLHAPEGMEELLEPLPDGVRTQRGLRRTQRVDMIVGFVTDRAHLERNVEWLLAALPDGGALWVAWPKRASKMTTDMTDGAVREIVLPLGWVDVKVCAIDSIWTGLKVVRRAHLRTNPSHVRIEEQPIDRLDEHGAIAIAFRVDRMLEVAVPDGGLGGIVLAEVPVARPWVKDYDAGAEGGPAGWRHRFDTSNWGLLAAFDHDVRIGGAVVAFRTPGVTMLEDRDDLAVLWDIRVRPDRRWAGVGRDLFHAAERWASLQGARTLKVETQNVNAAACRFYARMGCALTAVDRRAYPEHPDEAQMIWCKPLPPP